MADNGYRDLGANLRAYLCVPELRAHRTSLTARARTLADAAPQPVVSRALDTVRRSTSDFLEASLTFAETSVERSVLIEKQIDRRDFVGRLHERYHSTSHRFESHYHSSIQHAKRLANSIARLAYHLLPHEQQRGVRPGSFGRLFNSLRDADTSQLEPLESVRSLIINHGAFLETVVHEYRDDVIEHPDPRREVDYGGLVTSDDRLDVIRHDDRALPDADAEYTRDPHWPGYVYRDIWYSAEPFEPGADPAQQGAELVGYEFHVHGHANLDLREGQSIGTDTPMIFRTDGGSGHFDKHGPHSHIFYSRGIPEELATRPDVVYGMPGITELAQRYASLAADALHLAERFSM